MSDRKRIAVIGAGSAGLVALKSLLEDGHDALAFDQAADIGGLWNYGATGSDETYEETGDEEKYFFQSYKSVSANTSKYNTCFSDLPPGDDVGEFMTTQEITAYLNQYAEKFNLRQHIKLNCEVKRLDKASGKWTVTYGDVNGTHEEAFDHVLVASGAFGFARYPDFYSQRESFNGLLIHSSQVRNDRELFKKKRILFIGGGYSGAEMATIAVQSGADKVFVSPTHRPQERNVWTLDRVTPTPDGGKQIWDYQCTRENSIDSSKFGVMMESWLYPLHKTSAGATLVFPGDALGICNLEVMKKGIADGLVQIVNPISSLKGNDVILTNGDVLKDIDLIVMATGYHQRFPFLNHIWSKDEQTACELFNYVVSPNPKLDGIGFIQVQPVSFSVLLIGELQARWYSACVVPRPYTSDSTIFSDVERKQMSDEITMIKSFIPKWFSYNYIFSVQGMAERLAQEIGCLPPDSKKLMKSSSKQEVELGVALKYGPYTVAQYRVAGRGAWDGAKETCVKLSRHIMGEKFDELVAKAISANAK